MKRLAAPPLRPRRPVILNRAGFTLAEIMMAMAVATVVFGAALAGMISLQKSYAATEQFAASLSDQMRLVDYLSMDLRRATRLTWDADGNGLTLTLPDFYRYESSDVQGARPLVNTPFVPTDSNRAVYSSNAPTPPAVPPTVVYRFDAPRGVVTREEVPAGQAGPTNLPPPSPDSAFGRRDVAAGMRAFPAITLDNPAMPLTARLTVSFYPLFHTLATPDTNKITLHNLTFLRNNDVKSR